MLKQQSPFHSFRAYGVAFGGEITRPFLEVMESKAATAIPTVGGYSTANAGPFNVRDVVRFESASTQVFGVTGNTAWDTVITSRVVGLNIMNQVTADEIVAHLVMTQPFHKAGAEPVPARFNTIGSRFVNLRIGGVPCEPKLEHEGPCGKAVWTGNDRPVYDLYETPKICDKGEEKMPRTPVKGSLTTLVSELGASPCFEAEGNAVYVPDFGVVYLAEYYVKDNERQLNMFRFQLGCGSGGNGGGPGGGAGGST